MERPTLRQLEILVEVARIGTFRGAARHLGLSQVAISDHIRQLENRLGCALFVRNAGGKPSLSPSGRIVLEHGRNVLFACDALISVARSAADEGEPIAVSGQRKARKARGEPLQAAEIIDPAGQSEPQPPPVLLDYANLDSEEPKQDGGPSVIAEAENDEVDWPTDTMAHAETVQVVPVSLLDVMKEGPPQGSGQEDAGNIRGALPEPEPEQTPNPVIEKPITIASHPAILSRFQDKLAAAQDAFPDRPIAVDFARFTSDTVARPLASGQVDIALFYALDDVPGLPSDYLWSESWSLFARADHPLAQADMLRLADCVDMPVIVFEESNPLRVLCEACLSRAGLWPAPTVLETDDFAAIVAELIEYGEAVFPAFGVTAAQFGARQGLKRLALIEPLPAVQVRRALSPAAQEDPTIAALAGLLG